MSLGEGSHGSILNGNYPATRVTSGWKSTIRHFICPDQGDTGKSIARFPGVSTDAITRAEGESREQFDARAEKLWKKAATLR